MSTIIQVKDLSKSYIISHEGKEKYTTLRDVMTKKAKKIFSFSTVLRAENKLTHEEFWALKDIDFTIAKGDRVGIIGRNGAGKSTLLKILSRIVEPTKGSIKIKGRVASLLEVGTGFHPELSGRENIFLNGAILGMSRAEIRKHFDAIVDFAEIEKFLDTPVKRYSSGMYVRLAFSIAAHLEPEILVVDEVLAVGDVQFQKKCLGKMEDVSKNEGRTVLFVSHNMAAINSLCTNGIFLEMGKMIIKDDINKVIKYYLKNGQTALSDGTIQNNLSTYNTGILKFKKINIVSDLIGNTIFYLKDLFVNIELESKKNITDVMLDMIICNSEGVPIIHVSNSYNSTSNIISEGYNLIKVEIQNQLQPGEYSLTIGAHLSDGTTLDYVENIITFEVLKVAEDPHKGYKLNSIIGSAHFNSHWTVKQ